MVREATAALNGKTVAKTDTWEVVEGNIYFPPSSLDQSLLSKTDTSTFCPWKGKASYYTVTVDGKTFKDVAWYYPEPYDKASHIKDYVAFYKSKADIKHSDA